MTELVAKACGLSRNKVLDAGKKDKDTLTTLRKKLIEVRPDLEKETKDMSWGKLIFELFEAKVERHIKAPTFVTGHPIEVSPLARESDANPIFAERWELFANGIELANGFSELNDPKEQERRLSAQNTSRIDGNDEAMYLDRDFINAMKYGMPPASGVGLGIDRLLMYLCGEDSIREVIAFPSQKRIRRYE